MKLKMKVSQCDFTKKIPQANFSMIFQLHVILPLFLVEASEEEIDDEEPEELSEEDQDSETLEDEPSITKATLRARKKNEIKDKAAKHRELVRQISRIMKKTENDDELTKEEESLLRKHPKVFDEISR